jgi:hypothetical protein
MAVSLSYGTEPLCFCVCGMFLWAMTHAVYFRFYFNYIYCVYVSKMHRKRFFYEINTHLILFFEQTFPLKIKSLLLPVITPSLVPVYEFVCNSFRTGNLNCFRVKWPWRSTWHMCENLNPGRKCWKWPRPETAVST